MKLGLITDFLAQNIFYRIALQIELVTFLQRKIPSIVYISCEIFVRITLYPVINSFKMNTNSTFLQYTKHHFLKFVTGSLQRKRCYTPTCAPHCIKMLMVCPHAHKPHYGIFHISEEAFTTLNMTTTQILEQQIC